MRQRSSSVWRTARCSRPAARASPSARTGFKPSHPAVPAFPGRPSASPPRAMARRSTQAPISACIGRRPAASEERRGRQELSWRLIRFRGKSGCPRRWAPWTRIAGLAERFSDDIAVIVNDGRGKVRDCRGRRVGRCTRRSSPGRAWWLRTLRSVSNWRCCAARCAARASSPRTELSGCCSRAFGRGGPTCSRSSSRRP